MYGVAVNLIMSVSGHPSIINEILITKIDELKYQQNSRSSKLVRGQNLF